MITTSNQRMTRGQTLAFEFTLRDNRGRLVDLTGAFVYLWIRADLKVDASVKLASADTALHRIGIVIADQTGSDRGKFTATLIPSDTSSLVAMGADDPYLYDVWIIDATGARFPVITTSTLDLYPQITTTP